MTAVRARDIGVVLGGHQVLDGIDLDAESGAWVSVLGPNGAGKSTLLRAMSGLTPASGSVELDGRALGSMPRRERARLVALVPQAPSVPAGMTVADYVLLGRTPHLGALGAPGRGDHAAADQAMGRLDLLELATRVVSSLSGGERQRVFLARALAQGSPVLLLDEPTTALDIGHQQKVLELIDALRRDRGLTVISTMHDLTLAGQYADALVLLDRGQVVATGTAEQVLTEANVSRYYGVQARIVRDGGHSFVLPYRASDATARGTAT